MLGDSITANVWYNAFAAAAEAALAASGTPGPPNGGPYARVARQTNFHTWINSGVAGDDCTNLAGGAPATGVARSIANAVGAFSPDIVIMHLGINCVQHTIPDATCLTNHASILTQIKSYVPASQILVVGPLCKGENWPAGANADDAAIAIKNGICASTALAAGVTFCDLRPAFFAYEAINNPGHLTILGPLTNSDASAVHPNQGEGVKFYLNTVLPFVVYG